MTNVTVDANNIRPNGLTLAVETEAGEATVIGRVVRFDSDGDVVQADASSVAGVTGQLGIVIASGRSEHDGAVLADERVTVHLSGPVYLGADAGLDPTKLYYVSEDAGRITDVAPANARALGYPLSATVFNFQPAAEMPTYE